MPVVTPPAPTGAAPQVPLPVLPNAAPVTPASPYTVAPSPVAMAPIPGGSMGQQAMNVLNPIYSDAATRNAATADALSRALNTAQTNAAQSVANSGLAMHAPTSAIAAVQAIPAMDLSNLQNRALGYEQATQATLNNNYTNGMQGLANTLQAQQNAAAAAGNAASAKTAAENLKLKLSGGNNTLFNQMTMYQLTHGGSATLPDGSTISGLTPGEVATYSNENAKAGAARDNSVAQLMDSIKSALYNPTSKTGLVDPTTGLPTSGSIANAYKSIEGQFGTDMANLGVTPAQVEQSLNVYRSSLNPTYAAGSLQVGGKTLPLLAPASGVGTASPQLRDALDEYQANAQNANRANLMGLITKQYGTTIADQVRQAVQKAGPNISQYLAQDQGGLGEFMNFRNLSGPNGLQALSKSFKDVAPGLS